MRTLKSCRWCIHRRRHYAAIKAGHHHPGDALCATNRLTRIGRALPFTTTKEER